MLLFIQFSREYLNYVPVNTNSVDFITIHNALKVCLNFHLLLVILYSMVN